MGRVVLQTKDGAFARRFVIAVLILIVAFLAGPSMAMGLWSDSEEQQKIEQQIEAPVAATVTWEATAEILTPLVAKWEGKRNKAYFDLVGVATICFGHTRTITGADVRAGVTWSDKRCEELLRNELREYWAETRKGFTPDTIQSRLTPARDAAYASLAFNVGWHGVRKSTATRRLNNGDIRGGCEALRWWNKAGGRVVRGLVNRRSEEHDLCMRGLAV